jgi:predicted HicB family RNase H-like nuclease
MRTGAPDVSHYTYRVTWSSDDGEYVATCAEFPSLSWLDSSQIKALQGLEELLRGILADMEKQGEQAPQPFADRNYSGRFNLRVGEDLHRQLAMNAAESGISLNQYILLKLAATG